MSSELIKMYRLKQGIYSPMGNVKEGTESIYHQGYYAFPYIGRNFNDDKNGWLGNSLMTTDPSSMPEWFEEITDDDAKRGERCLCEYTARGNNFNYVHPKRSR